MIRDFIREHCDTSNLRVLFKKVDADGDLEVSFEEFDNFVRGIVARVGGPAAARITPEEIEDTFHHIDNNNSNTIDRNEFEQYMDLYDGKVSILDV